MRPRFVVVEGLDGTGKSTLARNLSEALGGELMSTPGPIGRRFRAELLAEIRDEAARALFYAATVRNAGAIARHRVAMGHWVVMDRYWLSTVAYAKARGASLPWDALATVNYVLPRGPGRRRGPARRRGGGR